MASFAPETIVHIGSIPITNTFINTLLVDSILIGSVFALKKRLSKIPGYFQSAVELITETFYDLNESVAGKNVSKIFPFFMSFFLFILIANLTGLIPGFGTIGFFEQGQQGQTHFVPLFRNLTSDLNATFGLALVSLAATHALSVQAIGIKEYLSRYFSLNPINLFVGVLEVISEFTKIVSLSFRLFGNIFAGEVVLITISKLFAFFIPIPFMLLEIIVGIVQAVVFSTLTMVFMSILMTPHHVEKQHKGVSE